MKLIHNNRHTAAHDTLCAAARSDAGIKAEGRTSHIRTRMYNLLEALKAEGYLDLKFDGPRGGARYHITAAGKAALDLAKIAA
jgi:hypothetical protein